MSGPSPYRLRDALLGLFVGLWLTGLPGFGLYSMAPETLRCEREGVDVSCRLARHVLGVPVRSTTLSGVRGATVEEYYSPPKGVLTRRDAGGYTYHVRYGTAAGPVEGAEGADRGERQAVVDGLRRFLADGHASSFEYALPAGPLLWRVALGLLFIVGVLCLINIPFATVAQLRRRARPIAALPTMPGDSPSPNG